MSEQSMTHETIEAPELYVRVNATQNSKGTNTDKTISVRGNVSPQTLARLLDEVSRIGDAQLEEEKRKLAEG